MCETALGAAILIHHSFEGSDKLSYGCLFQGKVSIRAPARGATRGRGCGRWYRHVSIRAPARGATRLGLDELQVGVVSIRAPARGATRAAPSTSSAMTCFNSRSREGSDQRTVWQRVRPRRFNSRSREGSDSSMLFEARSVMPFQFALPRGERQAQYRRARAGRCFNSRSREGSDWRGWIYRPRLECFNSRSREGSDAARSKGGAYV